MTKPAKTLLLLVAALCLQGCATQSTQPRNFSEYRQELTAYHDSGAYMRDVTAVALEAKNYLASRAEQVKRPALVFDIDETTLSNWKQMAFNQFAYFGSKDQACSFDKGTACGGPAWELRGEGLPIPAMVDLYHFAIAQHVAVYFISGRRLTDKEFAATADNLKAAGYDKDWAGLILRPTDDTGEVSAFKTRARADIETGGATIVVNLGDQHSDLVGGHAERAFLLPNPFYLIP